MSSAEEITLPSGVSREAFDAIRAKVSAAGEAVRALKADSSSSKEDLAAAIAQLQALKLEQEELAPGTTNQGRRPKKEKKEKEKKDKKDKMAKKEKGAPKKKETQLGLDVPKTDFHNWYSQLLSKADMIEYYDISGCYILRPWAFAMWEHVQSWMDKQIKLRGVENVYFPCFVSKGALTKEEDHVEGFAPEVAWVTKSGDSDLAEPIAIRPTSETVMYPAFAKWIQSHRDLPMLTNQWCNVVRWEFSHPTPFIRSREFLWQEGHCAFATEKEMKEDVYEALDMYRRAYEDVLAVPVIKGVKSEKEKFAGADFTTTVEAFVEEVGRGVQGATSHALGQNFAKMFDITFEDPEKQGASLHAWQTSWGFTTRSIGVMIMVHGDDKGLVVPPRVAPLQAVVVPIVYNGKEDLVLEPAKALLKELRGAEVRAKVDDRDNYNPGFKYAHWELRGVPVRVELGPRDAEAGQCVLVRRDTGAKEPIPIASAATRIKALLEEIQRDMLERARERMEAKIVHVKSWSEVTPALMNRSRVYAAWCAEIGCENDIKKRTKEECGSADTDERALSGSAKSLCIPCEPLRKLEEGELCFQCGKKATCLGLFGRSY